MSGVRFRLTKDELIRTTLVLDEKTQIQVDLQESKSGHYTRFVFRKEEGEGSRENSENRAKTVLAWAKNVFAREDIESAAKIDNEIDKHQWVIHFAPQKAEVLFKAAEPGEKKKIDLAAFDSKGEGIIKTKLYFAESKSEYTVEIRPERTGDQLWHHVCFGQDRQAKETAQECIKSVKKLVEPSFPDVNFARVQQNRNNFQYYFLLTPQQHDLLLKKAKKVFAYKLSGAHVEDVSLPTPPAPFLSARFFVGQPFKLDAESAQQSQRRPSVAEVKR